MRELADKLGDSLPDASEGLSFALRGRGAKGGGVTFKEPGKGGGKKKQPERNPAFEEFFGAGRK